MSDPSDSPLRLLLVEDNPVDAEFVLRQLVREGLQVDGQRVSEEAGYRAALDARPDGILADWSLPLFSGLRALQLLRERDLDIPFIIVSGYIGEEAVADALRHGADAYVPKDGLARLGTAVRHALAERRLREERRATEAALRESEERLRSAAEATGFGVYAWDFVTGEIYHSPEFLALYGLAPGEPLALDADLAPLALHPDDRADFLARMRATADPTGSGVFDAEYRILLPDGTVRWLRVRGRTVFSGNAATDRPLRANGIIQDITWRRRSEEALQQEQRRLEAHLANSPVAIVEFDSEFRVTRWAGQAARIFGWMADEILGRAIGEIHWVHEDDTESVLRITEEMIAGRQPSNRNVNRNYRKDGSIIHCEWYNSATYDAYSRLSSVLSIVLDVTPRVRAEEQLRALAAHLVAVREEDHTRMAREIHDEFGQGLSALRLDLTWMARRPPKDSAVLRRRVQASIALIDEMIAVGQRIVADLRPPILDDLGLVPAMEWYVQRFAAHSGIPITFDAGSAPAPELSGPLAVTAYRIVQEALTNVARHAQATHATIRIAVEDGRLVIKIRDDGRGIRKKEVDDPRSFGLVGMRERVASHGGTVQVTGASRRGTTVHVTMPFPPPAVPAP